MQKQLRFSALDGLRGFAAVGVFFYHGADLVGFRVASGYLAVDFFFCLSGFVIAAAYEQKLLAGEPLLRFLTARLTRLYPVYLLGMAIGLLFVLFRLWRDGTPAGAADFLAALGLGLLFLPSPPALVQSFSTHMFPFVVQSWSLFYELAANLCYAIMIPFLKSLRLVVILLLIFPFLLTAALASGTVDLGPEWETIVAGFARAFFSFFLGVLLLRLRLPSALFPGWVAWVCVIVLLAALLVEPGSSALQAAYDLVLVVFVFPALILAAGATSEGPRSRAIFSFMGAASYPLYILHGPILYWVRSALAAFQMEAQSIPHAFWLSSCALFIVVCGLVDAFYERPAIRWLRSKAGV